MCTIGGEVIFQTTPCAAFNGEQSVCSWMTNSTLGHHCATVHMCISRWPRTYAHSAVAQRLVAGEGSPGTALRNTGTREIESHGVVVHYGAESMAVETGTVPAMFCVPCLAECVYRFPFYYFAHTRHTAHRSRPFPAVPYWLRVFPVGVGRFFFLLLLLLAPTVTLGCRFRWWTDWLSLRVGWQIHGDTGRDCRRERNSEQKCNRLIVFFFTFLVRFRLTLEENWSIIFGVSAKFAQKMHSILQEETPTNEIRSSKTKDFSKSDEPQIWFHLFL